MVVAAAEEFVNQATGTVRANGRFTVALSGGSTPRSLFSLLATTFRDQLPWDKMFFFWGDERHVPPDHPESNYRMAYEALLSKVPVPAENVFRVPAEIPDANQAAADYEQTLRKFFQLSPGAFPRFDLILLGMGPDGHTASLFPGTSALQEKSRLVVANWVEKFKAYRQRSSGRNPASGIASVKADSSHEWQADVDARPGGRCSPVEALGRATPVGDFF